MTPGAPGPADVTPAPDWLLGLAEQVGSVRAEEVSRYLPPREGGRASAVLMLFAEGATGPDLLLIERAAGLRDHAGQPAFPGGAVDPEDTGPIDAALREAEEEVGLDRAGVQVLAQLPDVWIPVTGFVVTPVLGWWHTPEPVRAVDRGEVADVLRVPIAELADPANRIRVRHPSGWVGPAFAVSGLLVWGFTAGLIDTLLRLGRWEQPWQPGELRDLPPSPSRPTPPAEAPPEGTPPP